MTTLISDLNNLAIRCFFAKEVDANTSNPQYNLWKYFVTENIYNYIEKFNVNEIILAIDDRNSWRKAIYNRYKENRKAQREKSDVDWDKFFIEFEELQNSIQQYLPFKILKSSRAEADDIIAVLSKWIQNKVIIVSNDSDYLQLCTGKKVKVYNPSKDEYMTLKEDKQTFVDKLCLTGQGKDNIFNVLTPTDFPSDIRKPGLGEKGAIKIIDNGLDEYLDKTHKLDKEGYTKEFKIRDNFDRNKRLIDFDYIPDIVEQKIIECYNNYQLPDPSFMYKFFKERDWKGFLDDWNRTERNLLKLY